MTTKRSLRQRCRFSIAALTAAVAGVLCVPSAQAQDALLDRARQLIATGQPAQAFDLLAPQEPARAGEAAYSYLLGIAALDAGHVTRAIFALERVVEIEPQNNLARAELARAHLLAGETNTARDELRQARTGSMPAEAAAAIDRVLGALDQEPVKGPGSPLRGYLELSAGHDSNVNSATAAGQFALPAFGGIVFNLDAQNQRRGDAFLGVAGGVALQLPLDTAWAVTGAANARGVRNRHADDVDNQQYDGNLGLSYTQGPSVYSLAAQANSYDIDSHRYRRASGLSGQWQYALTPASQMGLFAQWSRLSFDADATRDANRTVLGASYARAFNDGAQIAYGSIYRAREQNRADGFDQNGHQASGVRIGAEAAAWGGSTLFAAVQFESRRYGGTEPFFDASRRDHQLDLTAGVHFVPAPLWRITPQVSYLRAASNIVLYDYRRTVVQITVRREFK